MPLCPHQLGQGGREGTPKAPVHVCGAGTVSRGSCPSPVPAPVSPKLLSIRISEWHGTGYACVTYTGHVGRLEPQT